MSYAIRASGTVVAWGRNDEGQLGDGTTIRRTTPVPVGSLTSITAIAGGRDHGLALRSDGTVWAWGSNDYGQVGNGSTTDRTAPVQVMTGAAEVIAGAQHSYARRLDGTVAAWGRNYRANLGDGTTITRTRPTNVLNLTQVVSIGSGRDTGMAVLADGRLRAWGHNSTGQVGDGTTTNRTSPVLVPGVAGAVLAGGGGAEYSVVVVSSGPPPPRDPVAAFTATCEVTSCSFDASASDDPDGTVVGYAWDFGDGTTSTGTTPTTQHEYQAEGTYTATLTVTDDSGATDVASRQVVAEAEPPPPVGPVWRATASVGREHIASRRHRAGIGPGRGPPGARGLDEPRGDPDHAHRLDPARHGLGRHGRAVLAADPARHRRPGGIDAPAHPRRVVQDQPGARRLQRFGRTLGVHQPRRAGHHQYAHRTRGRGRRRRRRRCSATTSTRVATAHGWTLSPTLVQRATTTGSGSGFLTAVLGEQGGLAAGTAPALSATSGIASSKAIAWTVVLPPT